MTRRASLALLTCALVFASGCRPAPSAETPPAPAKPAAARPVGFPLTLKDARGVEVTFPAPPQRIISMCPPLTETLFALGLGDRVVGVTRFCKVPPEAQQKEQIGGIIDPSEEKIVALRPDVVFTTVGNPIEIMRSLEKTGVRVFSVDPKTYKQVCESIETVARICDVPDAGAKVAGDMRRVAEDVRSRAMLSSDIPGALLVVWLDPLFVAGPGTFTADMLALCGARNVAAETKNPWRQFSLEMAVAADPDVIILTTEHAPTSANSQAKLEELRSNKAWRSVKAVKAGRVVVIQGDLVLQTGPRLAQGLQELARSIHPHLYKTLPGPQQHTDALR